MANLTLVLRDLPELAALSTHGRQIVIANSTMQ
jgi:hypothetical protein